MFTSHRIGKVTTLTIAGAIILMFSAASSHAAIIVPNDAAHVVGGSVTGTLVAIDVPTLDTSVTYTQTSPGGPSWTTGGGIIAHAADQGFELKTRAGDVYGTRSPWEPDGTPLNEAENYGAYNSSTDPEVTYYFNAANSGIDIPDGAIINAVYMTWNTRSLDNADWSYSDDGGGTVNVPYSAAPDSDLVLRWYPLEGGSLDANFEAVFTGPIEVDGGDGFILNGVRKPNTMHIDAVILDVSGLGPVIPAPAALPAGLALMGVMLVARRRSTKLTTGRSA